MDTSILAANLAAYLTYRIYREARPFLNLMFITWMSKKVPKEYLKYFDGWVKTFLARPYKKEKPASFSKAAKDYGKPKKKEGDGNLE
ncbi:hypothetical protein [Microbulbifer sp. JTAC008]|uniref:hypothetical protein n=1 Tax=unclassified Microbulbifer TaxID=2619833 RepID=UPI0040395748